MRWKPALSAFAITFSDRFPVAETYQPNRRKHRWRISPGASVVVRVKWERCGSSGDDTARGDGFAVRALARCRQVAIVARERAGSWRPGKERFMGVPEVVSREEWLVARKALLVKEKGLTRAADGVNAARRRLPMTRAGKDYQLDGLRGAARLPDLFRGKRQLAVYNPESGILGPRLEGCLGGGVAQAGLGLDDAPGRCLGEVVPQVPPVGDLQGAGCPGAGAV